MALEKCGRTVVPAGSLDHTVRVWDLATRAEVNKLPFAESIFSLAVAPSGASAVVGTEAGHVESVRLLGPPERTTLQAHGSSVLSMRFAARGHWFVSGSKDRTINIWRSPAGPLMHTVRGGIRL